MDFKKSFACSCAFLATTLALLCSGTSVAGTERPATMTTAAAQLSAGNVRQSQTTLNEALPLYKAMVTKNARKEQEHSKLSVVHLIVIIGKVLAPLVGAIIEPLLVNIAKGITWAITYSLATGFDKPLSYEHFIPALEHHNGGIGGGGGSDDDYDEGYDESQRVPVTYSMKELPGLALQMTGSVLSEFGKPAEVNAEATTKNAERKVVGTQHEK